MKILAIRIKNLASLEGSTEIDFTQEPLCSAGIFAITGPTGSGKTTLLDALCLALYAKTPRYLQARESGIEINDVQGSTISQGDVRAILRDGTAEGYAEADFVGVDGQHHRATWSVRRARSKADGSLQADTVQLRNLSTGAEYPGKKKESLDEIERLVGLSFEQFTRSVLLAQGDFTAFLKANKDEKSSLLEKLTGTHIYSMISRQVYERYKQEEQEFRELNLKKEGITMLTGEELQALHDEKTNLEKEIRSLEKQVQDLATEINWFKRLSELQLSRDQAAQALAHAAEAKKEAGDRDRKFKQIEQVQQIRSRVDALRQAEKQQAQKTDELKDLDGYISKQLEQKEELEKQLQQASEQLAEKTKAQKKAGPLLDEAKRLDTLIHEKQEQVNIALNDLDECRDKHRQQKDQVQDKKDELDKLSEQIEALQTWKKENIAGQPVAENSRLIVTKLNDARKLLETLTSISEEIRESEMKTGLLGKEKEDLKTQCDTLQMELDTMQLSIETLQKELQKIDPGTLEQEKALVNDRVEDVVAARAHWNILSGKLTDFKKLVKNLEINRVSLRENEDLREKSSQLLLKAQTKKETTSALLDKARIAAAGDVENLRSHLVDGEPCMVCGSTTHPYAQHAPGQDKILQQIEQEHRQNEKDWEDSLKENSILKEICTNLEKTIVLQQDEIAMSKKSLEVLQKDWMNFKLYDEIKFVPEHDSGEWLYKRLQELKEIQKNLLLQLQAYQKTKHKLEEQNVRTEKLEKELTEINNAIKDKDRSRLSLQEHIKQLRQQQIRTKAEENTLENDLEPYVTGLPWMAEWKNNPEEVTGRIQNFAEQWKKNTDRLEDFRKEYGIMSAILSGMEVQSKNLLEEAEKKQGFYSGLAKGLEEIMQKRKSVFGGEGVPEVENRLKDDMVKALENLERIKEKRDENSQSLLKADTRKKQLSRDLDDLKRDAGDHTHHIDEWIAVFNASHATALDNAQLLSLLSFTPVWMDAERKTLRMIDDEVTRSKSVLDAGEVSLKQHKEKRISDRQADELETLFSGVKSSLDAAIKAKNEKGFRLQQDEDNKKKIGELLKTIEAKALIADNWSKLNEIIGSADGKKFRQIAQEYTLDVLLGYANVHLGMLTKRYKIERIPASLGLQVLDKDMGDEVRTVYSLSGGESFLVSMALALGLASLSGSRMKVESLFIDEGFGSLDPATLNIAMDALERLHNQGRKVGVISHVQEMTERIPVQIRVSRMSSGKSKVELTGS